MSSDIEVVEYTYVSNEGIVAELSEFFSPADIQWVTQMTHDFKPVFAEWHQNQCEDSKEAFVQGLVADVANLPHLVAIGLGFYEASTEAGLVSAVASNAMVLFRAGAFQLAINVINEKMDQFEARLEEHDFLLVTQALTLLYLQLEGHLQLKGTGNEGKAVADFQTALYECNGSGFLSLVIACLEYCRKPPYSLPSVKLSCILWKAVQICLGTVEEAETFKNNQRTKYNLPVAHPTPPDTRDVRGFSKVHINDVEAYVQHSEDLPRYVRDSSTGQFKRPTSIKEGYDIMQAHLYVSLRDMHMKELDEMRRTHRIEGRREGVEFGARCDPRVDRVYKELVPHLSTTSACILSLLLQCCTKLPSPSTPSPWSFETAEVSDIMFHPLSLARAKEIAMKSLVGTLLVLTKYFKSNHAMQFEMLMLCLSDCHFLKLLLKLLNHQQSDAFLTAFNDIEDLQPLASAFEVQYPGEPNVFKPTETVGDDAVGSCSQRNMFSAISSLRLLQKLIKSRDIRALMCCLNKGAPIVKKCLKIQHPLMQLYALKVIKGLSRFLGRAWKRANMKLMTKIDQTVRHCMTDPWFHEILANRSPEDFQDVEDAIAKNVKDFHFLRYPELVLAATEDEDDSADGSPLTSHASDPLPTTYEELLKQYEEEEGQGSPCAAQDLQYYSVYLVD
eukprot:m.61549 g.61549  ORF g.61549 m.61549 type:complete len:672 (-) comp11871_c0_seq1:305-2320(-)